MDTAWIQVFVLTLTQCLAPAGKTICQEQEVQMQFMDQVDCELAKEHLVSLMDRAEDVIVIKEKTRCTASARERAIFDSVEEVRRQPESGADWTAPESNDPLPLDFTQEAHQERLGSLSECDDVGGTAPCKIGEIIIEGATEQRADVWRQE